MRPYKSSRLGPNALFRDRERMSSHQSLAGESWPLLEPLGQVSWGQLSVPEAWVFPEPKYLPSIIKKHWPSCLTLEGTLYFEGKGRQFPFRLPPGFFDGALIWAWGWGFSSPGTRAKASWPLWGLRDGRGW